MTGSARRWLGYALLALLVYFGFVTASLPATALAWLLARHGGGVIALDQPKGTVWNGSGVLRLSSPPVTSSIRWRLLPARLLSGALAVHVEAEHEHARVAAEMRRNWSAWSVHDLTGTLPAETVPAFVPAARLLAPQGELRISAETLRYGAHALSGTLEVLWSDAGTQVMNLGSLGQYRISLEGQGPDVVIRGRTESGDLEIAADGTWKALSDGVLAVQGTATARGRHEQLMPLLQMIGPARPDGSHTFSVRTQLTALPH